MCKSSLPAAKPRLRLRCKTAIVQKAAPSPAGKTRHSPTRRRLAIKQQLVLKARKAFALFLMDNTRVKKGALKIFEKGTHGRHEKSGQAMDRVHWTWKGSLQWEEPPRIPSKEGCADASRSWSSATGRQSYLQGCWGAFADLRKKSRMSRSLHSDRQGGCSSVGQRILWQSVLRLHQHGLVLCHQGVS